MDNGMENGMVVRKLAQRVVLQAIFDQADGSHRVSPSSLAPWVALAGIHCRDLRLVLSQAAQRLERLNEGEQSDHGQQSAASAAAHKAWATRLNGRRSLRAQLEKMAMERGGRIRIPDVLDSLIRDGYVKQQTGLQSCHTALARARNWRRIGRGEWRFTVAPGEWRLD